MTNAAVTTNDLRERAVARLKKRRDFHAHAAVYVLFNSFVVLVWAMTSQGGFFWPVFLILGWGIGLLMNAYDVYFAEEISEERIAREIERLSRRQGRPS